MKPKYSIGETVRIKATGEKKKIVIIDHDFLGNPLYGFRIGSAYYRGYELKTYRPSRTGKYRDSHGRFIQGWMLRNPEDVKDIDSKQRNYQKILSIMERIEKKIDELGRKV